MHPTGFFGFVGCPRFFALELLSFLLLRIFFLCFRQTKLTSASKVNSLARFRFGDEVFFGVALALTDFVFDAMRKT